MSSGYMIRIRLTVLFFTLLSLAVLILSSAIAHFAVILRDRARSDYINTSDSILDGKFQSLQIKVLNAAVSTAVFFGAYAIFGAAITVHPRWLQHKSIFQAYAGLQIAMAFPLLVTGSFIADHIKGFRTSFEKFGANDNIPYYDMMYYGGVAQAIYGAILVGIVIAVAALVVYENYKLEQKQKQILVDANTGEVPAPKKGEMESSSG